MKISRPIIFLGVIIIVSGILFHLQGQAIIGPESSFMYSNPVWVTLGQQIAIIGIFFICVGIAVNILIKT